MINHGFLGSTINLADFFGMVEGYSVREVAEVLGVGYWALKNHLKRVGLWEMTYIYRGRRFIPAHIVDRILGKESDPPRAIDRIEYAYSLSRAARMLGLSPYLLKKLLVETGLSRCCFRTARQINVPRSVVLLIKRRMDERRRRLEGID